LLALIHPTSRSASIFDRDCAKEAAKIRRTWLSAENTYYDNMKVRELVRYAADLYGINCDSKIAELSKR
jgi:ABC-2 type transport system ATP-binding protein